jgi:integrase/recombinase XerD
MASIRKRRNKYYSYVRWYNDLGKRDGKEIALKTDKKSVALVRNNEVERFEDLIKQGENVQFGWMAEGGKPKFIRMSIEQAFEEYLSVKKIEGVRQKTIDLNQLALSSFMNRIGYTVSIELITDSHINEWKDWSRKNHAPNTTNIYLSKMRTFFKFCYKKKYIKNELDIEMVKADRKPPMYLSETKLGQLFKTDMVDEHFRKAFLFYAMTGCRLKEPFEGVINGDWLIITPDVSKSHKTREVELNQVTKSILLEMRNRYDERIGKPMHGTYTNSHKGIIDTYSKEFKKAVKGLGFGEHKFHNLRDTYAVRRWVETGDIHLVSKEIGHSSVTMTEKYADFNLRRLGVDFPSLNDIIQARIGKTTTNDSLMGLSRHLLS